MPWLSGCLNDATGRNPFVNQVSFFLSLGAGVQSTAILSQSLRKSGQFLYYYKTAFHELIHVAIPS